MAAAFYSMLYLTPLPLIQNWQGEQNKILLASLFFLIFSKISSIPLIFI